MRNSHKIALTLGTLGLLSIGAGILYGIREKKSGVLDIDDVDSSDIPESTKNKIDSDENFDKIPAVISLKANLAKIYHVLETLTKRGGAVYNKETGKPVAEGLDQATWIQVKRRIKDFNNEFAQSVKPGSVKNHGMGLIAKLDKEIDRIFLPSRYNTNQKWYLEYLEKYPNDGVT